MRRQSFSEQISVAIDAEPDLAAVLFIGIVHVARVLIRLNITALKIFSWFAVRCMFCRHGFLVVLNLGAGREGEWPLCPATCV